MQDVLQFSVADDSFEELNSVFQTLTPPLRPGFASPADATAIDAAETALGMPIPSGLRELLSCTDGQVPSYVADPMFPSVRFRCGDLGRTDCAWLASLERVVELTLLSREAYPDFVNDEPFEIIGPTSYPDRFIDFTDTEGASSLCLGMAPAPGGTVGQVVMLGTQPCQVVVLAPDLRSFFRQVIDGFRASRFHLKQYDYCVWTDL